MAFPVAAGQPNYSGTFIPEIWSGKIIENFYDSTVLSQITNTDYEGEIRNQGDVVNIRTTPTIAVRDYVKGQPLVFEQPETEKVQLLIDKAKYFALLIDKVDKVQMDLPAMSIWSADAAQNLKIAIDTDVLAGITPDVAAANQGATAGASTGSYALGTLASPLTVTKDGASSSKAVIDLIVDMGSVLDEANVPESGRFLVLPPKMRGLIMTSELKDASLAGDGTSVLRNGRVGMIDRFTIYMSQNLYHPSNKFHILAGHKVATAFASQLTETQTGTRQDTFGEYISTLNVYGYKVVKPEALAMAVVTF